MLKTAIGCLAICILGAGCGGGGHPTAKVTGKVTYLNKPVTSGTINFISDVKGITNPVVSGTIGADGDYAIEDAPVGDVRITIISIKPYTSPQQMSQDKGPTKGKTAASTAGWMELPAKYQDDRTSGLNYKVVAGEQKHDIPLK